MAMMVKTVASLCLLLHVLRSSLRSLVHHKEFPPCSTERLKKHRLSHISGCLRAFNERNQGRLPQTVYVYRDGVGEGQMEGVQQIELEQMKSAAKNFYAQANQEM